MAKSNQKIKTLDCRAADNVYLHKDFHGALCYSIRYLNDNFGSDAVEKYLEMVGETFYRPLSERLKKDGLPALEKHWKNIFCMEEGKFELRYEGGTLVLDVKECPAVAHMKKNNQFFTPEFCETTAVINRTVCREAGYASQCRYEPGQGRCIQKFWKEKE